MKKIMVAAVIMLCAMSSASAAPQVMTGAEIREAFSGNTIDGVWGAAETSYKQYFDPSGSTIYVQEGSRPSQGIWWTNRNRYCSNWPPSTAESCYEVRRDGDRLLWVAPGGEALYPSTVLPGNRLQ